MALGGVYIVYVSHTIHGTIVYLPIHEWLMFMVNVGDYTIDGWYGYGILLPFSDTSVPWGTDLFGVTSGNGGVTFFHRCAIGWGDFRCCGVRKV